MRFGIHLYHHQIPQWADSYLAYDRLKALCASGRPLDIQSKDSTISADLCATIVRELEVVEELYIKQCTFLKCGEQQLRHRFAIDESLVATANTGGVDGVELATIISSYIELSEGHQALQWFSHVNTEGFSRIFSKVDRMGLSTTAEVLKAKGRFTKSRFVNQEETSRDLERIADTITRLLYASKCEVDSGSRSLFLKNLYSHSASPSRVADAAYAAIVADDVPSLDTILAAWRKDGSDGHGLISCTQPSLIRYALSHGSKRCIAQLLSHEQSSGLHPAMAEDWLHHIILGHSHSQAIKMKVSAHNRADVVANSDEECGSLIGFIFNDLGLQPQLSLAKKDFLGRLPLHYAAQYGFTAVCRIYLKLVAAYSTSVNLTTMDAILMKDMGGFTPLELSVISKKTAVTKELLALCASQISDSGGMELNEHLLAGLTQMLLLAIRSGLPDVLELLIDHGADPNRHLPRSETSLHVAAQYGNYRCAELLLLRKSDPRLALDSVDSVHGWTPLIVACVYGHVSIVDLLLCTGARPHTSDCSGWTPKEHAAFRGYLKIVEMLETVASEAKNEASGVGLVNEEVQKLSVNEKDGLLNGKGLGVARKPLPPQKTLRPSSLTGGSRILVTLGSPNTRNKAKTVDLNPRFYGSTYYTHAEIGHSIEIQAIDADASTNKHPLVHLPVLGDMIYEPWQFIARDPRQMKLVFNLFRSANRMSEDRFIVGSAIVLPQNLYQGLASHRESLARYHTTPILEKHTLKFMGTVTFGILIVAPHPHPHPDISKSATTGYWLDQGPTQVVGHRGSGANTSAYTNLQLGENTLQSFQSAGTLGASCVEFDVQLTKDLVPVIFHDFLVMEAGGDTPLYTLSLDQFLHLSAAQQSRGEKATMAETRYLERNNSHQAFSTKPRSHSLAAYDESRIRDLEERMMYTESAMEGAHKGNVRGRCVQGVFPMFEDLFLNLPKSLAFNVEMKYPMLWEAEDRNMDTYGPEINTYVDIALDKIYQLGGTRSITFSSFSPEVCILLAIKQQDYPVLFLSKAGSVPVGDLRCSGLKQSIQFARRWNLAGIVMLSDPLVKCPKLIRHARSSGVVCNSYGPLNNDPECAKVQAEAGLDAIIVDKVRLIYETLAKLSKPDIAGVSPGASAGS